MRVSFRTTIEKELLDALKKEAIDRGVNANDILEELLIQHIQKESTIQELRSMTLKDQIGVLTTKIMIQIDECLFDNRVDYRGAPRNIIEDVVYSVLVNFFDDVDVKK